MLTYLMELPRWALAIVLAVAGVAKLADRAATVELAAVLRQGLRLPAAEALARTLPVIELAAAALLAVESTRVVGSVVAALLFGGLAVGTALLAGRPATYRCSCFGRSAREIGWRTAAGNLGWTAAAAVSLSQPSARIPGASSLAALLTAGVLLALGYSAGAIIALAGPRRALPVRPALVHPAGRP